MRCVLNWVSMTNDDRLCDAHLREEITARPEMVQGSERVKSSALAEVCAKRKIHLRVEKFSLRKLVVVCVGVPSRLAKVGQPLAYHGTLIVNWILPLSVRVTNHRSLVEEPGSVLAVTGPDSCAGNESLPNVVLKQSQGRASLPCHWRGGEDNNTIGLYSHYPPPPTPNSS
jgi:hypothetical protein